MPICWDKSTPKKRKRAIESLIHIKQKWTGESKGRNCADGGPMRATAKPEDAASPTAFLESITLTSVIEAHEGRDVVMVDMPNAFVQTKLEKGPDQKKIVMRLRGAVAEMMVRCAPEVCKPHVVFENGQKVICVESSKALCGLSISALLFCKKSLKDLASMGFELNPYDPCVANKMINGKQMTIVWHVDDLKASHINAKVNDEFYEWLKSKCEDKEIGILKPEEARFMIF